jgi:hypothetical protein
MIALRRLAGALTLLLLLPVGTLAATPQAATPSGPAKPPMFIGVFLPGLTSPPKPMPDRIATYRNRTGRTPAMVVTHVTWGGKHYPDGKGHFYQDGIKDSLQDIVEAGSVPMLTWEPWARIRDDSRYALRNILPPTFCPATTAECTGRHKAFVNQWAREVAEWLRHPDSQGTTLYIRLAHEMNGNWISWSPVRNGNTTAEFKQFWKYIVVTFRKQLKGPDPVNQPELDIRSRVKWVYAPNGPHRTATPLSQIWPGDAYVDVLGFSQYNWGRSVSWSSWRSLLATFKGPMKMLTALPSKRPIIAAETASAEEGGSKAAWIRDGFAALKTQHPRLIGVVWYDYKDPRGPDWRINSSATALKAYRRMVNDPFYQGPVIR